MARSLSQALSFIFFALALVLGAQAHRNADSFGSRARSDSSLPTHIQDLIARRNLLHFGDKGPGPFGDDGPPFKKFDKGGGGGYGYGGGKSWFKGPHKRRQH